MKVKLKPARNKQADSFPFVQFAVKGIEETKGNEIVCLNLKKISNSPCDYFVICEGNSRTHVQAIAESVEDYIKKETGSRPWHVEGKQNGEWVLMDYVDVVVHVFQPHIRQHFALEDMWADAEIKSMKPEMPSLKAKAIKRKNKFKAKIPSKAKGKKSIKKKVAAKKIIKKKVKSKKK